MAICGDCYCLSEGHQATHQKAIVHFQGPPALVRSLEGHPVGFDLICAPAVLWPAAHVLKLKASCESTYESFKSGAEWRCSIAQR